MKIGCFMLGGKYPKIKLKMYITALLQSGLMCQVSEYYR